jgi:hypothetical protein
MGDTPEGEGGGPMEKVEGVKKKNKGKETRYGRHYGFEVKLRCVKFEIRRRSSGNFVV